MIELVGGPLDGVLHELPGLLLEFEKEFDLGYPTSFGLVSEDRLEIHWYERRPGTKIADYKETLSR